MTVISGWGVCDPWQQEEAQTGWHKRMLATLQPWKFINHKFTSPTGTKGRLMPLVFAMQHDIHSAQAMEVLTPGQWVMGGNEGEHGGDGSDVDPRVAAEFSRDWVDTMGPNFIAPGFGVFWQQGWDWADAYMAAGGFIGKVMQVSLFCTAAPDFWGQLGNLDKWRTKWKIQCNVILREVSAWPNQPDMQRLGVMEAVREALETKRIQQAYWYVTRYTGWEHVGLLKADGSISFLGRKWQEIGQA